jgi:hypothetical protein
MAQSAYAGVQRQPKIDILTPTDHSDPPEH